MPIRASWLVLFCLASAVAPASSVAAARCRTETFEATVQAGAGYAANIGGGLRLWLQPVVSGWRLRIVPATGAPPLPDYAEIATPPYQSPNPLLLSTEFGFRAQDVIAWNPRHFQYVPDGASYRRMVALYTSYQQTNKAQATNNAAVSQSADAGRLVEMVSNAAVGEIEVLDARLVPGIGDQSAAAAVVATHLRQTAHTNEQATKGKPTPLGRLTWLKVRIRLDLPAGLSGRNAGGKLTVEPCL